MPPFGLVYAATGVLFLAWAIRAWGRYARGAGLGWAVAGLALAAAGIDGLRALEGQLGLVPPAAAWSVRALAGGALAWTTWRTWRALGRPAGPRRPASSE